MPGSKLDTPSPARKMKRSGRCYAVARCSLPLFFQTHPDYLVYGGQTLMIGHLYSTLSNEFPREVGKRMGMTDALLRDLNYGLDLDAQFEGASRPVTCLVCARTRQSWRWY